MSNMQRIFSMVVCVVFTTGCASVGNGSFSVSYRGLSTDPDVHMRSAGTQFNSDKQSRSDAFFLRYSVPLEKAPNLSTDPLKETPRSSMSGGVGSSDLLWLGLAVASLAFLSSTKKDSKNLNNLNRCLADAQLESQRRQCHLAFGY